MDNKLLNYIFRRILYLFPVLIGVSLIIFLIFHHLMTDPAIMILGPKHVNESRIASFHLVYGLDRPLYIQYIEFLKSIFTFNLGTSWSTQREIRLMILDGIFPSLSLTVPIFLLSNIISITLALIVTHYRGKILDKLVLIFFYCIYEYPIIGLCSCRAMVICLQIRMV